MEPLRVVLSHQLAIHHCPDELKAELMERFTFTNPKWVENHRMGRWNRGTPKVLRYFRRFGGHGIRIPRGYTRQFLLKCRKEGFAYELENSCRHFPENGVCFYGSLKPFQHKAVTTMLKRNFGTLTAPTGSGKTVMALSMIAARKQPTLIVVHTKDLARQWMERIETFCKIPQKEIGMIGAGRQRIGKEITIAMVQSLYKKAPQVAKKIGYLLVDECHRCPSRTFTEAVKAFDAQYMTGLSATPWRRDQLSKLIFWYLGDVHHEVDQKQLEESGDILKAEAVIRPTTFKPYFDPVLEYSKMLSELTQDNERNRLIAADVAKEAQTGQGVLLVLSDRKKHCHALYSLIHYGHGIEAEVMTGDLKTAERRDIVERVNRGQIPVLIATGQLIGEGFDCKELSTLFLATPIRFTGRLIQYLGRILRPAPGKNYARVYDYVDSAVTPLLKAAHERQRIYFRQ